MNFWGTPPSTDGGAPTDHRPHPGPKGWERAGFGGAVLSFWGTPRYWGSINSLFGYQGLPIPPQDYGGPLSSPLLWGSHFPGIQHLPWVLGFPPVLLVPISPPLGFGGSHTHSRALQVPISPPLGFGVPPCPPPTTIGPYQSPWISGFPPCPPSTMGLHQSPLRLWDATPRTTGPHQPPQNYGIPTSHLLGFPPALRVSPPAFGVPPSYWLCISPPPPLRSQRSPQGYGVPPHFGGSLRCPLHLPRFQGAQQWDHTPPPPTYC